MDLFELTKELITIDSITGKEEDVTQFVADYLKGVGFIVDLYEVSVGRCNIFARKSDPYVVFSTHLDTVSPFFPFSEDHQFIYGRGACDAKGIMATQIKAAERLIDSGRQEIGLLFVVGEEGGSDGAKAANKVPNNSRFLINGEPTENKLAIGTKGAIRCKLITQGRAAHSAYPEQGQSAILKLLDIIQDVRQIKFPTEEHMGETTLNIGVISGGDQANVIPEEAHAILMFRTVTPSDEIKTLLETTIHGRGDVQYLFETDPLIMESIEGFESVVVSYATDIPLLTNWGKPYLIGPGSILHAHSANERISKESLKEAVDLYCKLVNRLLS
jgi:acetylornithine deacetylase